MKRKLLFALFIVALFMCVLAISVSAAAPVPTKPDIGVDFGEVITIDGFVAPSELYVNTTQRILLTDGNEGYVTYPTYYVTKDGTTFDFDFSKLNAAQSIEYSKKSVVMLEIPNGVTTIPNSYFSGWDNFPMCLSVQVPGTVTQYGQYMFNKNNIVRIVEFLDGEEPVTMGNQMFGAEWNGGAYKIGYVKFPNNLVSIGNNTFGKADGSSKVIILGANLKSIGTGFFSQATPETEDTFLYVSDNFFSESEMFTSLFGDLQPWHNNHLKLTIFYTGSQKQAQALVDKGLAVQPADYIWDKATLVSASEYDYETHNPKARLNITIAYDYEKCDAFYGGHHFGNDEQILFEDYFKGFGIGLSCANCDEVIVSASYDAMFSFLGYSCTEAPIGGVYSMAQFYIIREENIEVYKGLTGESLAYGFVTASVEDPLSSEYAGTNKVVLQEQCRFSLDYVDMKFSGITENTVDCGIVFCMYVNDGGNIFYLDGGVSSKTVGLKSYNDILAIN